MSQRLQITQEDHDEVFQGHVAGGADGEDGEEVILEANAKIAPFPFELSRLFVQEVISVWDAKVGVFLEVGSGECLCAALLERIKCVAVFKTNTHKKIVWARLVDLVKTNNLVSITKPERPAALVQWENRHKNPLGGNPSPLAPALGHTTVPTPAVAKAGGNQAGPTTPRQIKPSTFTQFGASQLNAPV